MKDPSAKKEAYEQLFEIIRPRPETSGWVLWALVGFVLGFVALLWVGTVVLRRRDERHIRRAFEKLSQERGLTDAEGAVLFQMAQAVKLENPLMAFSSVSAFENGMDRVLETVPAGDGDRRAELVGLFQSLRQKLRFDALPPQWALRHSRQIPIGTRMLVGFKRGEQARFCSCVVVENDALAMLVAPLVKADEAALRQVADEETLYIRFWMQGDTEYKFRSRLLPATDAGRETLLLDHAKDLVRLQRRDFFRLPVNIPLRFFDLPDEEAAERSPADIDIDGEASPRMEGALVNLSAGGGALHASVGLASDDLLVIDPMFRGDFSLGGVVCKVIRSKQEEGDAFTHYLEFVNVGGALQDRLVQKLYQRQLSLAQS